MELLAQFSHSLQTGTLQVHVRGGTAVSIPCRPDLPLWPPPEEKERYREWLHEVWSHEEHGLAQAFTHLKGKVNKISRLLQSEEKVPELQLIPIGMYHPLAAELSS